MKSKLFIILLSFCLIKQGYSQCSSFISGPSAAIANCTGPQISATATGVPPYTYNWSSPTLSFYPDTSANTWVSATDTGWHVVNVTIVDSLGCISTASDSIEFFPYVTTFNSTYCTLPDSICILDCPVSILYWTYTDTLGNVSNLALTDCIDIIGPGDYELGAIYEGNCTVIHTYHVEKDCGGSVNISEEKNEDISIYPNPSNGILNIKFHSFGSDKEIKIANIEGKIVHQTIANKDNIKLDLSFLKSGTYFVSLDDFITKMFFIQ